MNKNDEFILLLTINLFWRKCVDFIHYENWITQLHFTVLYMRRREKCFILIIDQFIALLFGVCVYFALKFLHKFILLTNAFACCVFLKFNQIGFQRFELRVFKYWLFLPSACGVPIFFEVLLTFRNEHEQF